MMTGRVDGIETVVGKRKVIGSVRESWCPRLQLLSCLKAALGRVTRRVFTSLAQPQGHPPGSCFVGQLDHRLMSSVT